VIAQMEVYDIPKYHEYASKVMTTIGASGGKLLAANTAEIREGELPFKRTIIGEFPSADAARTWYESDAYQAIVPLRQQATTGTLFIVEGFSMPS
jgi:uncharacterized protein (DUF1330 family)